MNRTPLTLALHWVESGLVPDWAIRYGIRRLLKQRLREERAHTSEAQQARKNQLIAQLRQSPLAIDTDKANEQHYEVPAQFFEYVLGPNRKYSSAYYDLNAPQMTLQQAEVRMLELTCQRAQIQNGEKILELGCGWGSLTLFMAQRFPQSQITGVSNSRSQREFILTQAAARGLSNIEIITADINHLDFGQREPFDRAVSVEMFEHVRNYQHLFSNISRWLKPSGRIFIHIFSHHRYAYPFEERDDSDWMAKYFFSGGLMPSHDLLLYFQDHLRLIDHWTVDGRHYERTSNAWLANMDSNRDAIWPILEHTYPGQASLWWHRWRIFFMACAELWGYQAGQEWQVTHLLFENRAPRSP
jgi:cyclopropane-fatty-acyl-phospholipid synthase